MSTERKKKRMEIFPLKRRKDKEIYIRQLSLEYITTYVLHCVQRMKKILRGDFKDSESLAGERRANVYFSKALENCPAGNECPQTMNSSSSSTVFLCLFHISFNQLSTHFLIHSIGDNLLLLLTSLGSKAKIYIYEQWNFLRRMCSEQYTPSCFMEQIKLADFDLSIAMLTNGFMIGNSYENNFRVINALSRNFQIHITYLPDQAVSMIL